MVSQIGIQLISGVTTQYKYKVTIPEGQNMTETVITYIP